MIIPKKTPFTALGCLGISLLFPISVHANTTILCKGGSKMVNAICVQCFVDEECLPVCQKGMKLIDTLCVPCKPEDNCPSSDKKPSINKEQKL